MSSEITFIKDGNIASPKGFLAGASYAGIKTYSPDKLDLGILYSEKQCSSAGVFTTNKVKSPSVLLTQQHLSVQKLQAVVVTSGIANACVGKQGMTDAIEMVSLASQHVGLNEKEMAICTTGLIGVELPMALLRSTIPTIELSYSGGTPFAKSILTTDVGPKEAALTMEIDGTVITIGGTIKGAGMIHPDMATMLCFLTTDANIPQAILQPCLKEVIDETLNCITVDGDTSTNDTVLLLANGASDGTPIVAGSTELETFKQGLTKLCSYLGEELIKTSEGAQKLIKVNVAGAASLSDARSAAKTIAGSSLVKTAIHGNDPNWGRILAALGRSNATVDENEVAININEVCVFEKGLPVPFFKEAVIKAMNNVEVLLTVQLNQGTASATALGCDLTEEYVVINSAYST